MENSSSAGQLLAIVVGSSTDDFVRHATDLLEDYGVKLVRCDDVYSAVGELAKSTDGSVLVIGRLEQLSKEQGRLFHIVSKKGIFCCCLADRNSAQMQRCFGRPELVEKAAEVFVINEQGQVEKVITKLVADNLAMSLCRKKNRSAEFIKDDFLTTKAELDALLGT